MDYQTLKNYSLISNSKRAKKKYLTTYNKTALKKFLVNFLCKKTSITKRYCKESLKSYTI